MLDILRDQFYDSRLPRFIKEEVHMFFTVSGCRGRPILDGRQIYSLTASR
jgi:hypothetical protein